MQEERVPRNQLIRRMKKGVGWLGWLMRSSCEELMVNAPGKLYKWTVKTDDRQGSRRPPLLMHDTWPARTK